MADNEFHKCLSIGVGRGVAMYVQGKPQMKRCKEQWSKMAKAFVAAKVLREMRSR